MTNRMRFVWALAIGVVAVLLLWRYVEMFKSWAESNPYLAQAYATIILAFFNIVFIAILFWDKWTDKPNLEIKIEGKTKISDNRYDFGVYVLNKGRKDAYNCSVSVQVFNQKSGKKIYSTSRSGSTSQLDLKSGETKSFPLSRILAFNGNFVARISAETHKSKTNKIVEYNIQNNYDPIIFKRGFVQYLWFHLNYLVKKYRNEWDTELFANGLSIFSDTKIRIKLIEYLETDGRALGPIIDRLENDPSDIVRGRAAGALGNIGDKRSIGPLLKCLRENKVGIKWWTPAIVKICDEKCVNELIAILLNRNFPTETRREVTKSLGEIGKKIETQTIEKAFIEALKNFEALEEFNEKRDAICSVVEALGKVGSEKSEEALKQLDENIKQECKDKIDKALEQIQFRISVGGNNIEEKY